MLLNILTRLFPSVRSLVESREQMDKMFSAQSGELLKVKAENVALKKIAEAAKGNEVDLTRHAMGSVTSKEIVDKLEQALMNDKDLVKECVALHNNKALQHVIDVSVYTFRDKIAAESMGRDADMLNRGGINGVNLIRDVLKSVNANHELQNVTDKLPKGSMDRFKTIPK